ncbi:MAG: COX15/CtaA family protein [Xanthomonadales bacterium]|nr:COX15/CtaA family protein [Xanthomonadales bacterium]
MNPALHRLALLAAIVAFAVIVLGAFVRLSDAGLGCPDWPGCYGHVTWPADPHEVAQANQAFPERAVETDKAWKEMAHRYLAGALVLLVIALNILAWKSSPRRGVRRLAAGLLILILFQAALGMWTVTLKLLPVVVMAHLMGGLATFSLLLWLYWTTGDNVQSRTAAEIFRQFRGLILVAFTVLLVQLALGGWTSANYSALACPDFPTCQGQLWPEMNFSDAFVLWREVGVDYEGGLLDLRSRVAIHMVHRMGAVIAFIILGLLALRLIARPAARQEGAVLGALLLAQVTLGIQNVVLQLPLINAVAHNGMGALLLAAMLWLLYRSSARSD